MKGEYPCPKCGSNDWEPVTWVEGEPYDSCKKCGYHFTSKDVPKNTTLNIDGEILTLPEVTRRLKLLKQYQASAKRLFKDGRA